MTTPDFLASRTENVSSAPSGARRYLARQPILDRHGRLHAYELLFRSGPETQFRGDGELATRTMIDNTVFFGMAKLTAGLPAFVNCTAEALKAQHLGVLPPSMTVLEILEDVAPEPDVIAACRALKAQGYRIALDDFVWKPGIEALVQLADYIKIDFMMSNMDERQSITRQIGRHFRGALLAEKLETRGDFELAVAEGFTFFQGYYFCKPLLISKRKVPANKMVHLRLLELMNQHPLDLIRISNLVKQDPALTYRLLSLVNSAATAIPQEIHSIQTALIALGDDLFRRMMAVAIASDLSGGKSSELLRMAFVRARFCELTAALYGFDAAEQYLMGILSLLPAMLDAPMSEVLATLPVNNEMHAALLGEPDGLRRPLCWLEGHEHGAWKACDDMAASHGIDQEDLMDCFTAAVAWAEDILPPS